MEYRQLGRTDLRVSAVGYGCGSVGGLMVRGDRNEMTQAVALAIDAGINYFDTARLYGNGQSETNLGQVLRELSAEVVVGTKVKLEAPDMHDVAGAVVAHVEGSLQRLGRERVDVVSLHRRPLGGDGRLPRRLRVPDRDPHQHARVRVARCGVEAEPRHPAGGGAEALHGRSERGLLPGERVVHGQVHEHGVVPVDAHADAAPA